MSDSKLGTTENKRIQEIDDQIAEIDRQLAELRAGKMPQLNTQAQQNTTSTAQQTTTTTTSSKIFYNDIINAPNREMYDLRNFHNFRSNNNYQQLNGQAKISPNPNRSYYLSDICYSDSINYTGRDKQLNPDVQTIVINEFQPNLTMNIGKVLATLTDSLLSKLGKGIDTKSPDSLASILSQTISNVGAPKLRQEAINLYSEKPNLLYGSNGKSLSGDVLLGKSSGVFATLGKELLNNLKLDPMEQIRYMFQGGKWLNTYELPFFNDTYLETCKGGSWAQEGINQTLSDGPLKSIMTGLNIDFPTAPIYKLGELSNAGKKDISFSFYLINKDQTMLLRNFQFLSAFFSGTQWVSMVGGSYVSPNVYNIHVPGRFQIYWATMKVTITCEGRLTRIPTLLNSPVFSDLKSVLNIISPTHQQESGGPLWPEAWKVECDIHDLTLNNFNTYIDYHVDGWNQATIASLEEDHSLSGSMKNIYYMMFDAVKQGLEKVEEWIKEGYEWCQSTWDPIGTAKKEADEERERLTNKGKAFDEARKILEQRRQALTQEKIKIYREVNNIK